MQFAFDETAGSYFLDIPNHTGSPERRLLLAILERAILDFVGNDPREAEEAEEWIFSDVDDPCFEPYTFSGVCRELDLDVQGTAQLIRAMPKRGRRRIAPWYFRNEANRAEGENGANNN